MTDANHEHTAPADLIKLPNGEWIDLRNVAGIRYMPPAAGVGSRNGGVGDRVCVDMRGHVIEFMEFDDAIAATEFRDDLAAKVNAARKLMRGGDT